MGKGSAIEWTHHTFNPVWGCMKVSPACDHCYAEAWDKRTGGAHWGAGSPRREFGDKHWAEPLKWNRSAAAAGVRERVFCASMADVFDKEWPGTVRPRLWDLIKATPALDWLLLTKRPQNAIKMLPDDWSDGYANVWLGTTVENQEEADRRIPVVLEVPGRVHFLSCEPLLGPLAIGKWLDVRYGRNGETRVDWVIAGGESGPGARPMESAWARALRDQCALAGAAFHFKQWGDWHPNDHAVVGLNGHTLMGKKKAGRYLDGRTWDEFPV